MKRLLLSLMGLGLLGAAPVLAQQPLSPVTVTPAPTAPVVVLPESGPACDTRGHGHHHVQCVPEPYVKETKKWVYNSCSEPICLCYRPLGHLFKHGCDGDGCGSCADGRCEHGYTRHYLVKKPR